MSEVAEMLLDEAQRDPTVYRLVRYAVFPNLGRDPKDCLMFAEAVR